MATAPESGKGGPSAQLVKELRDRTGAGFADCRAALVEAAGDIEQAINVLRKKGQAAAAKKAQRATSEGLVSCYIHAGGKIGVLVEINCESDFVARTDDFQRLCHDVAMHIAALDPRFLRREDVTQETLDRERDIYKDQAKQTEEAIADMDEALRLDPTNAEVFDKRGSLHFNLKHFKEAVADFTEAIRVDSN